MTRWQYTAVAAGALVAAGLACTWSHQAERPTLRLPGTVQIQEIRLGSRQGGRVAEVLVREGDEVKPGQELVRFEAPELEAKRDQLRAALAAAEADLARLRYGARPQEFDEAEAALAAAGARLDRLRKGPREEEKRQARYELEASRAEVRAAHDEWTRAAQAGIAASPAERAALQARHDRAQAHEAAAQARLDLLLAGTRPEEIAEAAAEGHRFQARLDLLRAGTRTEDLARAEAEADGARARLAEAEAQLREASVRAPEPAVIEVINVRKGSLTAPGEPVARVLRTDDLWVKAFVPATELGRIVLGQEVAVTIDSHPGRPFAGTVVQIAAESEFTPRNVQSVDGRRHQVFAVKVRVPDADGVFKAGMAAEVVVPLREVQP